MNPEKLSSEKSPSRGGMKEWQLLSGFIVWFAYAFAYSCLHAPASSWHCRLIGDCEHDPDVSTLWWTADLSGVSTAPLIRVSHYWTGGVGSERPPWHFSNCPLTPWLLTFDLKLSNFLSQWCQTLLRSSLGCPSSGDVDSLSHCFVPFIISLDSLLDR